MAVRIPKAPSFVPCRGRPPIPASQKELRTLRAKNKELERDLKQHRLKSEVAQALLDLQRKAERGQRLRGGKKRGRLATQDGASGSGLAGPQPGMADGDDG